MLKNYVTLVDREMLKHGRAQYVIVESFIIETVTTEDPHIVRSSKGACRISYHDDRGELQFRTTVPNSFINRWDRQEKCWEIAEKALEANPLY